MASSESINGGSGGGDIGGGLAVEMLTSSVAAADSSPPSDCSISDDQITPLLPQTQKPKINIFSVTNPKRRLNKEQLTRLADAETSSLMQFVFWTWNGSRYSGLLCIALSSLIYSTMEVVADIFTAQSIPLLETAFTRCTIILILSFLWLRRSGQPIFGPGNVWKLLSFRAIAGYISLLSFIFCIQMLPLSEATILSFITPVTASVSARIMLHEKLKFAELGGLTCSFFGVLFIFRLGSTQGALSNTKEASESYLEGGRHVFAVLVGLFSAIAGGISYCFTRSGAKASDQPVLTLFSFALLASPASGICTIAFSNFVVPRFYTLFLMIFLSILAFLAEITLARGLQLEKTSRVANILYLEAALTQLMGIGTLRMAPSFSRLIGCLLILISACCTMFIAPEKENE